MPQIKTTANGEAKILNKRGSKLFSPPRPNINNVEYKAIQQLKTDKIRITLTAEKGVAMVVMDRKDYLEKAANLLEQSAYRELTSDSTNKYETKIITILKRIKKRIGNGCQHTHVSNRDVTLWFNIV